MGESFKIFKCTHEWYWWVKYGVQICTPLVYTFHVTPVAQVVFLPVSPTIMRMELEELVTSRDFAADHEFEIH